jgi:protein phosphatase
MEDAVLFHSYADEVFLCGVFDGHTGSICAVSAVEYLIDEVFAVLGQPDLTGAFANCFSAVNAKLKDLHVPDGCTAAAVLVVHQVCFIAGVGDSRVVRVLRNGYERSTKDSKPFDRTEFDRLRKRDLIPTAEARVDRKLAVARSLGDFYVRGEGLFEKPKVYGFEISDDDVAMVIACDGLWDVMNDEAAANVVREAETAADAAVALRSYALALGTKDNVSVIVLKWHTQDVGFCGRNTVEPLPILPDEEDAQEQPEEIVVPVQAPLRRRR